MKEEFIIKESGLTKVLDATPSEECREYLPRSWLSYFRDAWHQENLLHMKIIEKMEKDLDNKDLTNTTL